MKDVCKAHNRKVRCVETGQIFESATIAAKEMNLCQSHISAVCRGERKTHGGYHWEVV